MSYLLFASSQHRYVYSISSKLEQNGPCIFSAGKRWQGEMGSDEFLRGRGRSDSSYYLRVCGMMVRIARTEGRGYEEECLW
jgi:hypothetical protein